MSKEREKKEGYVKKETLLIVSVIMLIIGFIGGVAVTIYKSGPAIPVQQRANDNTKEETQPLSDEMAAKMVELEKKTTANPEDVVAWTELGHLYFDSNNYDKAIKAYRKSLDLNPDNADVWTDLGVMYRKAGNPKEAIKCFDKAIELNPKHEIARFNKGIVLMHDLNDVAGAVKAWEELVKINPDVKTPGGMSIKDMIQRFKAKERADAGS